MISVQKSGANYNIMRGKSDSGAAGEKKVFPMRINCLSHDPGHLIRLSGGNSAISYRNPTGDGLYQKLMQHILNAFCQ
jgi:hypothetical protein